MALHPYRKLPAQPGGRQKPPLKKPWLREFARRLRYRMLHRHVKASHVAYICHVSQRTVESWMDGSREPSANNLMVLAHQLEIDPRKLWYGDEWRAPRVVNPRTGR